MIQSCNPTVRQEYPAAERRFKSMIARRAAKLTGYVSFQDAQQELRMELMKALHSHDSATGALEPFVSTCLRNCSIKIIQRTTRLRRVTVQHEFVDGQWGSRRVRDISYEGELNDHRMIEGYKADASPQETAIQEEQDVQGARAIVLKLMHRLDWRSRRVLITLIRPPKELLEQVSYTKSGLRYKDAAAHLGMSKGQFDHVIQKIRRACYELARDGEFTEAARKRLVAKGWPLERQ